jgi:hypothetical protein
MTSVSLPRRVGRYEIVREVGRGGTAVVYLSHQTDLDRDVALKELAAFHAADPAFVERFLRESRLTGSLNHPNIVTVHEYFEQDGTAFIAMEYFERGSLRPLVSTLTLPQVAGVLDGLLGGLAHAEKHGIVHRDLKPENVMVTSAGGVKIADFGMAKMRELEAHDKLTDSGTTVGTPAYMAPEQALGRDVGPATDLYSVGVIAYELLTGGVPFDQAEPPMAIMLRHLNDEIPPPRSLNADLDPELSDWVERMLAKNPGDRPRDAADAAEELEEIVIGILGPRWRRQSRITESRLPALAPRGSDTTIVTKQLGTTRRLGKRRRTWGIGLAIVCAVVLIAGGVATAFALSNENQPQTRAPERTTEKTDTTTRTTPPVAPALLAGVDLDTRGDPVLAALRLTGPALRRGSIRVRDGDITDGYAWFVLRQPGIDTHTKGAKNDALSVRVRKGKNFLRIDLKADEGALTGLEVRREDGHTVVATMSKPAPSTGSQSSGGTTTVTETTDSTTTTDTTPQDPFGSR